MSIGRRKNDHLRLTKYSQIDRKTIDDRFVYEPVTGVHPDYIDDAYSFLGKKIGGPLFISSITGGSHKGNKINRILAAASKELNLPMGLGSIRPYLENINHSSFNIRSIAGSNTLIYGNIGITQCMQLLQTDSVINLENALETLELDGLIIHINPLQEWIQPEGDYLIKPPLTILKNILPQLKCKIIIKEVGCGFGPKSLKELMGLPIDAIDLAGFGGTNFTKMELFRSPKSSRENLTPFTYIGNTPDDMISNINNLLSESSGTNKEFIISGGIKNFLDGYYYNSILNAPSIYGYAAKILKYAVQSETKLIKFLQDEIKSYSFAKNFLDIKR